VFWPKFEPNTTQTQILSVTATPIYLNFITIIFRNVHIHCQNIYLLNASRHSSAQSNIALSNKQVCIFNNTSSISGYGLHVIHSQEWKGSWLPLLNIHFPAKCPAVPQHSGLELKSSAAFNAVI
jgi:hypothetical protein